MFRARSRLITATLAVLVPVRLESSLLESAPALRNTLKIIMSEIKMAVFWDVAPCSLVDV
jgi:hypothetical protein